MAVVNALLLEEDPSLVAELQSALRKEGYAVTALRDGASGLARAVVQAFDVIVVSAELPGMNGFRVCNRIKRHATARLVPLVLTATLENAGEFVAHRQLATRADRYFEKPLRIDELVACVRALVGVEQVEHVEIVEEVEVEIVALSEPPPGLSSTSEDRARMQALLEELEAARKEVAPLRALRERLTAHEQTIERLTRELASSRGATTKNEAHTKEVDRLRKELALFRQTSLAEKEQSQKRVEEANKRVEARRLEVERIHQELIAEKKARGADAGAHERSLKIERDAREKERAESRAAMQAFATEREASGDKAAREDAEARLSALETEHEWEVSALSALLEQARAEMRDRVEVLERRVQELDAALARTRENLDAERRDRLVEECEAQDRVDAFDAAVAAAEARAAGLATELQAARLESAQLETEIEALRNELVNTTRRAEEHGHSARVSSEELDRKSELLERARKLLEEFAGRAP
jgi:DNA-binding response OmpR family regulator